MADQQACAYAALLLHDCGVSPSADAIRKVIDASGVKVRATMPVLFANYLEAHSVSSLMSKAAMAPSTHAAAPAAAAAAAPAAGGEPAAKKKEEKKAESEGDDDMGFGLFD